jgi:hypothetical protein
MDRIRNPYVPGAGTPPPELAGRTALIREANDALSRIKTGRPAQSLILVGLRGVGKTVLLVRLNDDATKLGFKACLVEAHEGKSFAALIAPEMRKILLELDRIASAKAKARRGLAILRSFVKSLKITVNDVEFGLSIDPEPGVGDSGDLERDFGDLLVAVGEAAKAAATSVCLLVDELQYLNEKEFSALIMAIHKLNQNKLPFLLIGAGLPQILALAGESKSYAERLFKYPHVGALEPVDARAALENPAREESASYATEALDEILRVTERYPYFLQQWGHDAWNAASGPEIEKPDVEKATVTALQTLDESFFKVRFDRCTPSEKRYMRALAELGPGLHRSGDIAEKLGVAVTSVAPTRSKLIRKGMIYSPSHGGTAFTVPLFDAFMRRAIPKFP